MIEGSSWKPLADSFQHGITCSYEVLEVDSSGSRNITLDVCIEKLITIFINGMPVDSISVMPYDLEAFACGHLVCEGHIASACDVTDLRVEEGAIRASIKGDHAKRAACKGNLSGIATVEQRSLLYSLMQIERLALTGVRTGGTHFSSLYSSYGGLLSYAEDAGRAGAMKKAIGKAIIAGHELNESFLLCTGRISSAMVRRACTAGIPVIAGTASPSNRAVSMAKELGMTLISMPMMPVIRIFSEPDRISGLPAGGYSGQYL